MTEEYTPELFRTIMEYTDRTYESIGKTEDFDFCSYTAGNGASLREISFSGGSSAGAYQRPVRTLWIREHKLLFCGDQIMTDIVPIVCTQYKDWGMLHRLPQQPGTAEAFLCGLSLSAGSWRTDPGYWKRGRPGCSGIYG